MKKCILLCFVELQKLKTIFVRNKHANNSGGVKFTTRCKNYQFYYICKRCHALHKKG